MPHHLSLRGKFRLLYGTLLMVLHVICEVCRLSSLNSPRRIQVETSLASRLSMLLCTLQFSTAVWLSHNVK